MRKLMFALVLACGAGIAACDQSPTDSARPQYDVHTRTKPTTTSTTSTAPGDTLTQTTATSGGEIGDPCDPETYQGPYRCILRDPNDIDGGYVVAY